MKNRSKEAALQCFRATGICGWIYVWFYESSCFGTRQECARGNFKYICDIPKQIFSSINTLPKRTKYPFAAIERDENTAKGFLFSKHNYFLFMQCNKCVNWHNFCFIKLNQLKSARIDLKWYKIKRKSSILVVFRICNNR